MRMRFEIRAPSKDNVSSPCSTGKLVRASFPDPLRAQQLRTRNQSRFPLIECCAGGFLVRFAQKIAPHIRRVRDA